VEAKVCSSANTTSKNITNTTICSNSPLLDKKNYKNDTIDISHMEGKIEQDIDRINQIFSKSLDTSWYSCHLDPSAITRKKSMSRLKEVLMTVERE